MQASPPDRSPDRGGSGRQPVGSKSRVGQASTPPAKSTQLGRVLAELLANDEVCGSELYSMYIPRFSAHLHRLKKQGFIWSKRPCDRHDHDGTQWLYKLEALPFEPAGIEVHRG